MIRLLISVVCALGLALVPVGVGHAHGSPTMTMANCAMGHDMADKAMPHGDKGQMKMSCCNFVCHAPSPVATEFGIVSVAGALLKTKASFASGPERRLTSARAGTLDPPPRI